MLVLNALNPFPARLAHDFDPTSVLPQRHSTPPQARQARSGRTCLGRGPQPTPTVSRDGPIGDRGVHLGQMPSSLSFFLALAGDIGCILVSHGSTIRSRLLAMAR